MPEMPERPLVLFDGLCNLCTGSVNFIIDRDPGARFTFAPLQSPTGQANLTRFGLENNPSGSVVLIENEKCFTRSTAALRIARELKFPWPLMSVFFLIPRLLRDVFYDFIAGNRYRWFGRRDSCRMPGPEIAGRFVDGDFADAPREMSSGFTERAQ